MQHERDFRAQNRLQRQFNADLDEIKALERDKVFKAAAVAFLVSLIGTVFMVDSVLRFVGEIALPGVLLVIPGFVGWGAPYLLYRAISKKKSTEVVPLIDQKDDEIYAVCEQASQLLQTA